MAFEIAVYGKGGIGKSTVSASISTAPACAGKRVLQIGCDPKHDSVHLIMGGANIPTMLDYLRDTPSSEAQLEDILQGTLTELAALRLVVPSPAWAAQEENAPQFAAENVIEQAKDALSQRAALYGCAFNGAAAVHLTDATCEQVAGLRHAPLSIMASDSPNVRALSQFLTDEFGLRFMDAPCPLVTTPPSAGCAPWAANSSANKPLIR